MKLLKFGLKPAYKFLVNKKGAVTVDWVVIAAIVIGFGFAVNELFFPSMQDAAQNVGDKISANQTSP